MQLHPTGLDRLDLQVEVARIIADLAGFEQTEAAHLAQAIQYRALDRRLS